MRDVIEHGICEEIRLRGEDEMHECLADNLDNAEIVYFQDNRIDIFSG